MLITERQGESAAGWRLVRPLVLVFCLAAAGPAAALDLTPPVAGITQPADGSFQPSLPSIAGTAFDSVAVASVTVSIRRNSDWLYWDGLSWTASQAWFHAAVSSLTWSYSTVPAWVNGSTYTVNAKAMDTSGNWSMAYATSTFVYGGGDAPPGAVSDLAAAPGAGVGSLLLSWSAPGADISSGTLGAGSAYYIQFSTAAGGPWSAASAQVVQSTSGVIPFSQVRHYAGALDPGTTYYLSVWHKDPAGNFSAVSNTASAYAKPFPGVTVTRTVNGDGTWHVYFGPAAAAGANSLALDEAGNVYAAGAVHNGSNYDQYVHKYDPSGNLLLAKYFNGAGDCNDSYNGAVAVDRSDGSFYMVGHECRAAPENVNLLIKYSAAGQVEWVRTAQGNSAVSPQGLAAVTLDAAGNVYVGGAISNGGDKNSWVRKYSPSGDVLWTATQAYSNNFDWVAALAVSSGSLYAAGSADMSGIGQGQNATLWKLDLNTGLTQWTTYYTGAANRHDDTLGAAADAAGNVYLAGDEQPALNDYALLLQKRGPAGPVAWKSLINYAAGASMTDQYTEIALSTDSYLYAAGYVASAGQGLNLYLSKTSTDGALLGDYVLDAAGGDDIANGLALSSASALLAGYETLGGQRYNFVRQVKLSDLVPVDSTAPAAVADLAAVTVSSGMLSLTWTAPGDDGAAGALSGAFLIQYATHTGVAWSTAAAQVSVSTSGQIPGAAQLLRLNGLTPNTTHYARLWTRDEAGNYGGASNAAVAETKIEPPASVYFDEVRATSVTVSAYAPASAFTGLGRGVSGVNVALDGAYGAWNQPGDAWAAKAPMPTARASAVPAVVGGKAHFMGGWSGVSYLATHEEYDPAANSWTTKAALPEAYRYFGAGVIDGRIYAVGGINSAGTVLSANRVYDPAANSWSTKAPLPGPRYALTAAVVNGKLYAVGGINLGTAPLTTNTMYDPATDTWATKAPLPTARYAITSAALNGKIYVFGGYTGSVILNTNEEYDVAGNAWSVRAAMPSTRYHPSSAVIGGKVYVMGGYNGSVNIGANEEYDPLSNLWTTRSPMPTARRELSLASIGGTLYAVAGWSTLAVTDNETYTPGTAKTFTGLQPNTLYNFKAKARGQSGIETAETVNYPVYTLAAVAALPAGLQFPSVFTSSAVAAWSSANGPGALFLLQASTAADFTGALFVSSSPAASGTVAGLAANTTYYFRVRAYNAAGATDGSWLTLGSALTRIEAPSGVVFDEVQAASVTVSAYAPSPAFTGLGHGLSGVNLAIDGAYGAWNLPGDGWAAKAPMPTARTAVTAAAAGGKAYFMGGWTGASYLSANEEYDPATNSWAAKAALPEAYRYFGAGVIDGKIYAVGGINSAGTVLNANRVYDPAANSWTTKAPMPSPRYSLAAAGLNGKLYALGGINAGPAPLAANEMYDPAADAWSVKAPLPTARYVLTSATLNGRIYAIGGYDGSAVYGANEAYDPASDSWATLAAMPTPRSHLASGVAGGKVYTVGGYSGSANYAVAEEYDPAANIWSVRSPMPTARRELAVASVDGTIYAVGGWSAAALAANEAYTPGTARTFTGLQPNTLHSFKAKARGAAGAETAEGPQVSTWTLASPPAGLAAAVHVGSVTLGWGLNGNPPGTLAQVYRSTDNVSFALLLSTPALALPDAGLLPYTTYYYRVRYVNGAGVPTAFSQAAVFSGAPAAAAAIAIPGELAIFSPGDLANITGSGVNLRPVNGVKVRLKRLKEPVAWWHEPTASWVASDTFTFVSPSGGFWVQGINGTIAFTEDIASYTVTAEGYNADGVPQAVPAARTFFVDSVPPLSGVVVPASGSTVHSFAGLSGTAWDPGASVDSVSVMIMRLSDGYSWDGSAWTDTPAWNLAAGTAAWTYTGLPEAALASGASYYASALAVDLAGNEQPAGIGTSLFTYLIPALGPLPFSGIGTSSLTVNWGSDFPGGTVYGAILSTMPAPVPVFAATTTALSQTFEGLAPNTSYYGYVSTTPGSGYLLADVRATLAMPASSPAFTGVYYSSFVFTWSAGLNPVFRTRYEYNIAQSTSFSPSFSGSGLIATITITGRPEGSTWYARVRALNINGIASPYAYAGPITTLIAPASGTVAGLAATLLGTSSVSWHWNAGSVAQAAGYGVFAASGGALGTVAFSTAGAAFVQEGLSPNMPVAVRVGAYTAGGYGDLAQSATYFTLAAQPGALAVTGRSDAQVSLGWDANGNPAGTLYQLLRSTSADFAPAALATTTALTHGAAGLVPGTAYYFRVRAVNGGGLPTAYGAAVSTATLPPLPARPAAPEGAALGVSSISWTWAAVGGADSYVVRPATAPGSALAGPALPAFVQAGLLPNTTYSVAVGALNGSGEGPLSPAAAPVSTLANPPAGLSAAVFATSATLTWGLNGNPAGTSARVLRAGGTTGITGGLVFTDSRLLGCTTYFFSVWNVNRDGLPTGAAETGALFTSSPAPLPPGNLSAQPLAGGRIFLSWEPAPFEGITGYNLYSDNGTGTVNYAAPLASLTAQQTSYTTPVLSYGTVYKFGLRAAHRCGVEEKNTSVRASAAAMASLTGVRAAIKVPQTGKKVSGNSVTVMAELTTGDPSETLNVRFQFRASGAGAWLDIPAKDPAAHPNPDAGSPYFIHWDVTGLTPGAYELRAVATDLGFVPDTTPAAIMISVDPAEADIVENASGGKVTKSQVVNNLVTNTLQAADSGSTVVTKLEIPAGALDNSTATVALTNNPAVAPPPPADAEPVGVVAEVVLSNQSALAGGQTAAVTLPFPDADGDGVVDGTTMHANQLVMYSAHTAAGPWQRDLSSVVDVRGKKVTGYTTHFSFFALFAPLAADLNSARAYPVPWKPGSGGRFDSAPGADGVVFDNLTDTAEIRIFNIAGQLVREYKLTAADLGFKVWDGKNSAGQKAGSGVYLVHIKAGSKTKVLKIAVER